MAAKYFKSEKGKDKLLDEYNYAYDFHRASACKNKMFWRCEKRNTCRVRVHTSSNNNDVPNIIFRTNEHNHPANVSDIEARVALSNLKGKVLNGAESSSRALISETVENLSEFGKGALPQLSLVSRSIRNWRNKSLGAPSIPIGREGFEIPQNFKCLEDGSLFLQTDTGSNDTKRLLIFASDKGLDDVQTSSYLAMDGTFKSSPSAWYQLLTIHCVINGSSFPRIFILMPDKREITYDRALKELKKLIPNISPSNVMTDFERALYNTCQRNFENVASSGCFFHFCQNVYRKICELGYKVKYSTDGTFQNKIKMFCALAFLPEEDVIEGFQYLSEDEEIPIEFVSYFELNYIGVMRGRKRRDSPLYPVSFWNVNKRVTEGLPRTNNAVEGFHSALRSSVTCKHPNIWKFITALKKEEALQETKIIHVKRGDARTTKKIYKSIDQQLKTIVTNYDNKSKNYFLSDIAKILNF